MLKKTVSITFLLAACLVSGLSYAGGVVLNGTRIIYPSGQKQSSITVRNTSDNARFMVQSWAEDASGKKPVTLSLRRRSTSAIRPVKVRCA